MLFKLFSNNLISRNLLSRNLLSRNLLSRKFHLHQNYEKMELQKLINQYILELNKKISTTNCDIDKFLLSHEIEKLVKLKNKINTYDVSPKEINENKKELNSQYLNYINKKNIN